MSLRAQRSNLLLVLVFLFATTTSAESDTPSLRICSQNLFRFGEKPKGKAKQLDFLINRMIHADCDIVAVQEVIGKNEREAETNIDELRRAWQEEIKEPVDSALGESYDEFIRSGFLIRRNAGKVVEVKSYIGEPLPRLQPLGPAGRFLRAPVALIFDATSGDSTRRFYVMNIHLKSRSRGFQDPSGTDFELLRMEMSAGVREIVLREEGKLPRGTVFVIVGDRNGDSVHAASEVLSGERALSDFTRGGGCRLTENEQPDCGMMPRRERQFIELFEQRRERFPRDYPGGSYSYKGKHELIDEILVRPHQLELVERPGGRLGIGFEGQFFKGSDHKMLWAEFKF